MCTEKRFSQKLTSKSREYMRTFFFLASRWHFAAVFAFIKQIAEMQALRSGHTASEAAKHLREKISLVLMRATSHSFLNRLQPSSPELDGHLPSFYG
jgi:hypothetical protein